MGRFGIIFEHLKILSIFSRRGYPVYIPAVDIDKVRSGPVYISCKFLPYMFVMQGEYIIRCSGVSRGYPFSRSYAVCIGCRILRHWGLRREFASIHCDGGCY